MAPSVVTSIRPGSTSRFRALFVVAVVGLLVAWEGQVGVASDEHSARIDSWTTTSDQTSRAEVAWMVRFSHAEGFGAGATHEVGVEVTHNGVAVPEPEIILLSLLDRDWNPIARYSRGHGATTAVRPSPRLSSPLACDGDLCQLEGIIEVEVLGEEPNAMVVSMWATAVSSQSSACDEVPSPRVEVSLRSDETGRGAR